jgi:NAD(P)-dependent dehydrogenase (short-subunit alcohol dehydrogenase family)
MERFGKIDALANVAGITHFATTVDTSDDEWNNVQATNLAGVFYCCRAAMREMLKQKSGSIVNVSSASAVAPYAGVGAYAAAKAGLHGYSRVLALEAAPHVRVNVVAPGPVDTELFRATVLSPEGDTDGLRGNIQSEIAATVPLGRVGLPIDLARTIAFLLSDWAAFTTGQVLHVNGGRAMR